MKQIILWSSVVGMALLSGCVHKCVDVESIGGQTAYVGKYYVDPQVAVKNIKMVKNKNGTISGAALLKNTSDTHTYNVVYRFRWMHGPDYAVGEPEPWQPLTVRPNATINVKGTAPSKMANQFFLSVCRQ